MLDFQNNHTIMGFFVWDLPILQNDTTALGKILGGWQVTADGYWSFVNKGSSVYAGYDSNADGVRASTSRRSSGDISYPKTEITGQGDLLYQWFDPSAFAYPDGRPRLQPHQHRRRRQRTHRAARRLERQRRAS